MKVCIVVLDSLTGNTVIAAEFIKRGIAEHTGESATVDVISVRTKDGAGSFDAGRIAEAELLGFGTPTICYKPTPGVLQWLSSVLPQECIARKSFFTFATYGTHPGVCAYMMAEALLQRNCACTHIGVHEVFTPDTYMWFLPRKGEPQMKWSSASVRACKAFGARIAEAYSTGAEPPRCQLRPSLFARVLTALTPAAIRTMLGDISVDRELCVGCGACVRACPTGALCMKESQQKQKQAPVWSSTACVSCTHCVATCKRGALRVPTSETRLFYDARGVDPEEVETVDNATGQTARIILRFLATGAFYRPVASIRGIAMYVWALAVMFVSWVCGKNSSQHKNKNKLD